jgi:hypothetical protein
MRNLITVYLHQSYIVSERFEQLNWFSDCCLLRHGYGLFFLPFLSPLSAFLPAHLIDFVFDPLAEPFRRCHKPGPLDSMS